MSMADFKKVKRCSQRDKDIVYGYIKQIQLLLPFEDNSFFIIVQLIQDLCLLYFHTIIDTKILTNDEQMKLLNMIHDHTKQNEDECKLLFRASRDGFGRSDFYEKCNLKSRTICIIETPQNNVFGGYTSLAWDSDGNDHEDDPTAFVYIIRSSEHDTKLFPVKNNGINAIQHYFRGYLSFGKYGSAFYMHQVKQDIWCMPTEDSTAQRQYGLTEHQLNGLDTKINVVDIEVHQLSTV